MLVASRPPERRPILHGSGVESLCPSARLSWRCTNRTTPADCGPRWAHQTPQGKCGRSGDCSLLRVTPQYIQRLPCRVLTRRLVSGEKRILVVGATARWTGPNSQGILVIPVHALQRPCGNCSDDGFHHRKAHGLAPSFRLLQALPQFAVCWFTTASGALRSVVVRLNGFASALS